MDGPLAAKRVAAYRFAKQKAKEAIQKLPGKIDSLIINQANKKMKSSRGKKIFNHFYGTTKPVTFLTKMAHDEAKRKLHQLNPLRRKTRQKGGTTLYSPDFQREMKALAQIAKQRRKNQTYLLSKKLLGGRKRKQRGGLYLPRPFNNNKLPNSLLPILQKREGFEPPVKKQKLKDILEDVVEEYDKIKSSPVLSKVIRPAVSTQKVIDNLVANAGEAIITKAFGIKNKTNCNAVNIYILNTKAYLKESFGNRLFCHSTIWVKLTRTILVLIIPIL